jgi:NIMA-interacting peptidyl-prolyl cis-trans isomerase 1
MRVPSATSLLRPLFLPLALLASLAACGAETSAKPAAAETAGSGTTTAAAAAPAPAAASTASPAGAGSTSAPVSPAVAANDANASSNAKVASASDPNAAASVDAAHPKKITARHILIQWMGCTSAAPSVVRTREQARVVAQDVLRRVKAGEDFPRLVVEFSDEPNAGARGGSLGRFGHGAMVKEFEEAAFALKPGEVSDVVESPFGYHVIQRLE